MFPEKGDRGIGNQAAAELSQITRAVKQRLKVIRYRPHLIDGCLTNTGMTFDDCPGRRPISGVRVQLGDG
nr:hypothetical protein [Streptomyces chattanoogensis]